MKKVISFIINIPKGRIDNTIIKIIVIDVITFLIGFVVLMKGLAGIDYRINDGIVLGAALIVLGTLIRRWRKEFRDSNL